MMIKQTQGFTIMELLIAIAIIGILAAFALPSYLEQVEKGRQTEGKALIGRVLQAQERYFTENLTYTTSLQTLGFSNTAVSEIESEQGYYKVSLGTCSSPAPTAITGCVKVSGASTTGGKDLSMDSIGNNNY